MRTRVSSTRTNGAKHRLIASLPHPLKSLDSLATISSYHRSQEICRQGSPADHWYCVILGAARRFVIRADGRRQIVDLLLPGDFFGLSSADEYDFAVEAVTENTTVATYPRRRVEILAESDPAVARAIRQVAFEALERLQSQLLILGRITAREKVGSFILELATRMSDGKADNVVLPVSRYDIADYLAVSVETVSRSLTDLQQCGVISLDGTRQVKIVDRDAIEDGDLPQPPTRIAAHAHAMASRRANGAHY
jgi:CRP/FNR family transcriptional regulator, nitrogen fixation regulation protein